MLLAPDLGLFVVRRHGGHVGGQVASQLAVRTIDQVVRTGQPASAPEDRDPLVTAIRCANYAIFTQARQDPSLHNAVTTVVGVRQQGDLHICRRGQAESTG